MFVLNLFAILGTGDYYSSGNDLSNFAKVQPDQVSKMASDAREVLKYDKHLNKFQHVHL